MADLALFPAPALEEPPASPAAAPVLAAITQWPSPQGDPATDPPGVARPRADPVPLRFELPAYDLGRALILERELGISRVLAQILVRRGWGDPATARAVLHPDLHHDPRAFEGLDRVLGTLKRHIAARNRITVHGDYDVDGVCATAVLVRALRALGADVGWYIPSRREDGYGLSPPTVARLAAHGTRLLVTVDCGITAVEEVAAARAAGVEVIVTDHHTPRADGRLPDCPILHPVVGSHPTPDLCGTAVAWKLALALEAPGAEADLELVALATVADLMPLTGENRCLVRDGLAAMAATDRPGLRALMEVSGTDPSGLDASALGFRLAPRINAAGRLRRADAALELLLTPDAERAREIAAELDGVNAERRAVEQRIGWEADALIAAMGERPAYVLAAEGWHPGVIGIVASRVVERYHRPAVLIGLDGAQPASGSGRSIPGFDLLGALHAAAPHLIRYGGHRAAAGLTVAPELVPAVREAIERHAEAVLTPELLEPVELVEAIVSGSQLSLALAEELLALEPCGMGNPSPNLLVCGARFEGVRTMGEGRHARFAVSSGGARAAAVAFGCEGRLPGEDGAPLDASFRLERNVWRGTAQPRAVLRHAVACCPAPITVVGEPQHYLNGVLEELRRPLAAVPSLRVPDALRTVLDRREESALCVLADALSAAGHSGGRVLAVCADVGRRRPGLEQRAGGFALVGQSTLARHPELASNFLHVVVLDPPTLAAADEAIRCGDGYAHLSWGEPELRFAEQMHELEYALRTSLVALYRSLKLRQRVTGEELEQLLRGEGRHPRPARLAGRLVRVLTELELVSLDPELPALTLESAQATDLERSGAYRVYSELYEEGLRFLNRARPNRRT